MSFVASATWWNSRFATERAGERIGVRFSRTTRETRERTPGRAASR
jgi:hypothetical protein